MQPFQVLRILDYVFGNLYYLLIYYFNFQLQPSTIIMFVKMILMFEFLKEMEVLKAC